MYIVCEVCMYMYVCMIVLSHLRFGPPVRFWCMQFESKHNYFKDASHQMLNIPKTMAERHQEFLCYSLHCGDNGSPFMKETMAGPGIVPVFLDADVV